MSDDDRISYFLEFFENQFSSVNPKNIKFTKISSLDSSTSVYPEKDIKFLKKIRESRETDADTLTRGR